MTLFFGICFILCPNTWGMNVNEYIWGNTFQRDNSNISVINNLMVFDASRNVITAEATTSPHYCRMMARIKRWKAHNLNE